MSPAARDVCEVLVLLRAREGEAIALEVVFWLVEDLVCDESDVRDA